MHQHAGGVADKLDELTSKYLLMQEPLKTEDLVQDPLDTEGKYVTAAATRPSLPSYRVIHLIDM